MVIHTRQNWLWEIYNVSLAFWKQYKELLRMLKYMFVCLLLSKKKVYVCFNFSINIKWFLNQQTNWSLGCLYEEEHSCVFSCHVFFFNNFILIFSYRIVFNWSVKYIPCIGRFILLLLQGIPMITLVCEIDKKLVVYDITIRMWWIKRLKFKVHKLE